MNTAERQAWIQAARITGERARQRQLMDESRARGWEMAMKQLVEERNAATAEAWADWARSQPRQQQSLSEAAAIRRLSHFGTFY